MSALSLDDVDTDELIDDRNIKYRLRQFGKFRCLVVLTALLFALAVAFLALYCVERSKSSPSPSSSHGTSSPTSTPSTTPSTNHSTPSPTQKPSPTTSGPVCYRKECVYLSEEIYEALNRSVDPCDDFYAYSCGGYFKSHRLNGSKTQESAILTITEDNMKILKNALENPAPSYSKSTSVMKTVQIYKSCVNTAAIDKRGNAPLVKLIEDYGGWRVTGGGLNGWKLQEKMGAVLRDLNVQTMLTMTVETAPKNSSKNILSIGSAALGMSPFYYTDDSPDSLKIRQAYQTFMNTTARLLGAGDLGLQKMADIYDFEKSLAKAIFGDLSSSDDLVETIRKFHRAGKSLDEITGKTINDFCNESQFDCSFILGLLNSTFQNQAISFTGSENVVYGDGSMFSGLASLYRRYASNDSIIKDYIMWRVIDSYVIAMPSQFFDAKMRYEQSVAQSQNFSRWMSCIMVMLGPLDMPLGRLFVDAHFDETTKSTVKDMTTRLRQAFIDNLKTADWMDNSTKENAKGKALAMQEDVGYPSYIKDDSKLDAHYSSLDTTKDLFENTVAVKMFMAQKNLGMMNQPVNKDKWMQSPAIVNAYNSLRQNRIVILAGILQSPYYKKGYPKYLNYGSLAMVIGHEITHGFDSSGRLYDKNGNLNDWWTSGSEMNFKNRTQCLVNQYSNYQVFGTNIDGYQTLNENIADNGGIKMAYDAYHAWVKDNAPEGRLPGQGFTADQLFFLGFSMPWCSVYTKQAALNQVAIDSHSFPKYRVIGSLSNFDKFAEAFNCPRGSAMNPYNKCSVW